MFFGQFVRCILLFFALWFGLMFIFGGNISGFFLSLLLSYIITMLVGALLIFKNKHDYNLAGKLFLNKNSDSTNNIKKDN
jgi:hypothetical protein